MVKIKSSRKTVLFILMLLVVSPLKGQDSLVVDNVSFEELDEKLKSDHSYKYISVIASSLYKLPESILKHNKLEKLVLVGNSLESVPLWFNQLTKLRSLDLSYNPSLKIDTTLKILSEVPNLEELSLRGNNLYHIPGSILGLKKLTSLNLSRNQLWTLPVEFSWLDNLERLSLDECENLDISSAISVLNPTKIKYLSFYQTPVKEVPEKIMEFKSLQELWLNHTGLEALPINFVFENLKTLGLSGNSIQELPELFKMNKSLERLFLTGNQLSQATIVNLKKELPETIILF